MNKQDIQKNPLVSVYILCYNHEKYVAEAIESVLNQTYTNLELVIVDNASIDNSRKIIETYIEQDSRIKFYPLEINTFASYGSNYAIKKCLGEYITPLSADDYFALNKIEIQLNYIQTNDIKVCFTWVEAVDDFGHKLVNHGIYKWFNQNFDDQFDLFKFFMDTGNGICAITWMFKKEIFAEFGYFDNRLLQTQDFNLWLKIIIKYPITVLKEKLTYYRVRDDGGNLSISGNKGVPTRYAFEVIYFAKHIINFPISILSKIIGKRCTKINKYKNLFEYYISKNNILFAFTILQALYEKLGDNFEFPSEQYLDFFQMYSNFDFSDSLGASGAKTQLYIGVHEVDFFEEDSFIEPIKLSSGIYEYDLSNYNIINSLRFDPLNLPCRILLNMAYIIDEKKQIHDLIPACHNGVSQQQYLLFEHNNPMLVFKLPHGVNKVNKFIINVEINPLNKWDMSACLTDKNTQLLDTNCSIKWLEGQVEDYKVILSSKEEGIKWLEGQVEDYKVILSSKEEGIRWLEGQVEDYKVILSSKEEGIRWLEGQVEDYKVILSSKEERIRWLEGQVEDYKVILSSKEEGIRWIEGQVENYKSTLSSKKEENRHLEGELVNYRSALEAKEEENKGYIRDMNNYKVELENIYNSVSWKVFQPLRKLKEKKNSIIKSIETKKLSGDINALPYRTCYKLITRSELFDKEYYLIHNVDVAKADMNPLEHFIKYGWKEGRNPSIKFNINYYLQHNIDIKEAQINPLIHYILYGTKEGRNALP